MIALLQDPQNPQKLTLTATVTVFLDRLLVETLDDAVAQAVTEQARKDLQGNKAVRRQIAEAATTLLLKKLGVEPESSTREQK
jgi:hypothetical protein